MVLVLAARLMEFELGSGPLHCITAATCWQQVATTKLGVARAVRALAAAKWVLRPPLDSRAGPGYRIRDTLPKSELSWRCPRRPVLKTRTSSRDSQASASIRGRGPHMMTPGAIGSWIARRDSKPEVSRQLQAISGTLAAGTAHCTGLAVAHGAQIAAAKSNLH